MSSPVISIRWLGCFTLALALLGCGLIFQREATAKADRALRLEGTLVAVDLSASSVTVKVQSGVMVVVLTNANTKIERNGMRVTLAAFRLGDRVQARFANTSGNLAIKLEAAGP